MSWQDLTITTAVLLMSYALIPQVIKGFKTKKSLISIQTAGITAISLYTIAFVYLTLNMYFSFVMNGIVGTLWAIILIQSIIYKSMETRNQNV